MSISIYNFQYIEIKDVLVQICKDSNKWISIKWMKLLVEVNKDNFLNQNDGQFFLTQFDRFIIKKSKFLQNDKLQSRGAKNDVDYLPPCSVAIYYNPSLLITKSELLTRFPLVLNCKRLIIEINQNKQNQNLEDVYRTIKW